MSAASIRTSRYEAVEKEGNIPIQVVLDSLDMHISVLDGEGIIQYVNEAWEDFARSNGDPSLCSTGIGVNYLEVCRAAAVGDPAVREIVGRLEEVLAGKRAHLTWEYPCHSPGEKRWFLLRARALGLKDRGAVVAHVDITQRKLAEEAVERTNWNLEKRVAENVASLQKANQNLREALEEVQRLKDKLEEENIALREAFEIEHEFPDIIGNSDTLKYVLFKVQQVGPTDAPVFIAGETGTGKELVAYAIHRVSPRKDKLFVKVNCAALPPQLIESELFGHEKGAYTGAHAAQIGRFELAKGGTIFLDEVGELPLELQPKLLRVLQDGEFEKVGNPRTLSADVRIIAATNRDVREEIKRGRFREDLWYRLNVFPITVPPLRERREDIPILVEHFVAVYNKRLGKSIVRIPTTAMEKICDYDWPGNIRELENVIHRAMIVSHGSELVVELPEIEVKSGQGISRLEDVERKHILRMLQESGWKIEGKNGAAEHLGLNPGTLRSRMKKLGIQRPR